MLPKEIRTKRIELLKELETLNQTTGNDKQIREIGEKLLGLINDRKHVNEEETSWKKEVREPRNFNLTVEEYIELVRYGLSNKQIVERLKISIATLQRWQVTNNINKRQLQMKIRRGEI